LAEVDFAGRMSNAPDEELVMISSSGDLVPAAVEAAKAELRRRNFGPDDFARLEADRADLRRAEQAKALIPLGNLGRIVFLIFGILVGWSVIFALVLGFRGYRRTSVDAFKWIAISLGSWFCLILIILNFT
jgi:hypothetical protein